MSLTRQPAAVIVGIGSRAAVIHHGFPLSIQGVGRDHFVSAVEMLAVHLAVPDIVPVGCAAQSLHMGKHITLAL